MFSTTTSCTATLDDDLRTRRSLPLFSFQVMSDNDLAQTHHGELLYRL